MREVYIDSEYRCHVANDGTMTAVQTSFFDNKCDSFIEGYRYVPKSYTWIRSDGAVFHGEMIAPWKDYRELDTAQRVYERQLLAEYEQLINELYSEVTTE